MAVKEKINLEQYELFLAQSPEHGHFELFHGEIVEKMPTQYHAWIVALLVNALMNYLKDHPMAWVLVEARYRSPDDMANERVPDISVVLKQAGRSLSKKGAAFYMPELAIEVQSPDQSDKFMVDKAAYYLAHGSSMVWLIYPAKQLVEVLTLDERHLLTLEDDLTGGNLLPDFRLKVSALLASDL